MVIVCLHLNWATGCRGSGLTLTKLWSSWREKGQVLKTALLRCDRCHLFRTCLLQLYVIIPSDEAHTLLKKTWAQSRLILAETHPLQGELADAMARAYATVGENKKILFNRHLLFLWRGRIRADKYHNKL